jgi:hypothetical protein
MYAVKKSTNMHFRLGLGENQRLVTNEPVDFEK